MTRPQAESETLQHSVLNGMPSANSSLREGLGVYGEEEAERLEEPEVAEDSKEAVFQTQQD